MKKSNMLLSCAWLSLCAMTVPTVSWAKVVPGENILSNGALECDQIEVPAFWHKSSVLVPGESMHCMPSGGPGGKPSVRFTSVDKPLTFSMRQQGLKLVPGAKYRISAMVRTKNFKAGSASGIVVIDFPWIKSTGIKGFPSNQEWKRVSREFKMITSKNVARYGVVIYMHKFTGELEIADMKLEALDEAAQAGSEKISPAGNALQPRLVPVSPVLWRIPPADRRITFRFFGVLPDKGAHADCDVVLKIDGLTGETRIPLVKGDNVLTLPEGISKGRMTVQVVRRADGKVINDDAYRFKVVEPVTDAEKGSRRLNNLVTVLLEEKVTGDDAEYGFSVKRDAWLHLSVSGSGNAKVELDGIEALGSASLRGESFRFVTAGCHRLRVRSAAGGTVAVRRVPETLNYPSCCDSAVKGNPPYDWNFHEKHVFPVCTTLNGGRMPEDKQPLFRARGGRWLANFNSRTFKDADDLVGRFSSAAGMTEARYDGITCDEQFFNSPPKLSDYTTALKRFSAADESSRLIYSWIVGKPSTPGLDQEFASACINASRGRGRVLFEIYCRTCATEEDARTYLEDYLVDTPRQFSKLLPNALDGTGVILGNFNQMPLISLALHPEVDIKYYLDMQFNMLANHPLFDSLGCVGYWGSYYADEEVYRWSMALLRHYCVEGKRTMLSDAYGYRYLPGHLANGDFRTALEGWQVSGNVTADSFKGLGRNVEKRWGGAGGLGDTFALFTRTNGTVSTMTQKVKRLVPGRLYCLQACTFDADALRAGKTFRKVPLSLSVAEGGKVLKGLSWHHVDVRKPAKGKPAGPKANVLHSVFEATGTEAVIEISDAAAPEGSRLGVNAVSLNPYFEEADQAR